MGSAKRRYIRAFYIFYGENALLRFWVDGGQIVDPIKDLCWDESLYDALGSKLMALTAQAEIDLAVDSYFQRALGGSRTPGALIDQFTFTL